MKKCGRERMILFFVAALLVIQMIGCVKSNDKKQPETETTVQESRTKPAEEGDGETENTDNADTIDNTEKDQMITMALGKGGEKTLEFGDEDWDADWDADTVTGLVLTENGITAVGSGADVSGSSAVIRKGGTYVVSGILHEGQIRIEAGDGELVHLVLNGAELSNAKTAPIYGADKTKVVLTLERGTRNSISDGDAYIHEERNMAAPGESDQADVLDALIFVNGDLTINGEGTLEIQGTDQGGIRSGGNLKVMSGLLMIDAWDYGLEGKDFVVIRDGELAIRSEKDGIKSEAVLIVGDGSIDIAGSEEGLIVNGQKTEGREGQGRQERLEEAENQEETE